MLYNKRIAGCWDLFIGWNRRLQTEGVWLNRLIGRFGIRSVLDVAAGTGFHAITLAKRGYSVEAWDVSTPMLSAARRNAAALGVAVKLKRRSWLSAKTPGANKTYDCVLCLGNSYAHLLTPSRRRRALLMWCSLLNPAGILVLDVRNFDGMSRSRRSQIPFSYHGPAVVDILSTSATRVDLKYSVAGCQFRLSYANLSPQNIRDEARACGFEVVKTYGNGRGRFKIEEVSFYQLVLRKHPRQ